MSIHAAATATSEAQLPPLDRRAYERFLPMIRRVAMRMARKLPRHIAVEDLIGYGSVGLMEAYERAPSTMPEREFELYASYRVRGAMIDHLRALDPATRDVRKASRKLAETVQSLTQTLKRAPAADEVARALGVPLEEYHTLVQRVAEGSLARMDDSDVDDVQATHISHDVVSVDDHVGRHELGALVADAILALSPRLQQILALYYQEECTLREIGKILGVTESRVCQLHTEAMRQLRRRVAGNDRACSLDSTG
jgi:RNA polymerase sigma factor FliA